MAPNFDEQIDCLPLIPEEVLKRHACHEPLDTRFRSAARLLQSIWRTERGLPIGSYVAEDGKRRKLGSRISDAAARAGGNFLTAEIAHVARRESAYRELGAMIDEERLATNLLSSMPLAFNLFAPLKIEPAQATSFLHELIPSFVGTATQVVFEHSPGRGDSRFLADYTAFDALIRYRTPEGRYGFVAFEVKYSESMREPVPQIRDRYEAVAERSELFVDPSDPALRANPLQQLWREHLLSQTMIDADLYDEGYFVVVAPALNHHVQQATGAYQALLAPPRDRKVRFIDLSLEQVIAALRLCDPAHADALHRRYCDWWRVDGELELAAPKFGALPTPKSKRTRPVSSAAEAGAAETGSSRSSRRGSENAVSA